MKKIILLTVILFILKNNFYAQEIPGLELHLKSKTNKIELYQELWLESYLVNLSSETIRLFKIGYSEPGWNGYQEKWEGILNGNPMELGSFLDLPTSSFTLNSFVELLPGDSLYAGLLRYKIIAPGKYKIKYTLSQSPSTVKISYAANSDAAKKAGEISSYTVSAKPFEFSVTDKEMAPVTEKEISDEELAGKPLFSDLEKAFSSPSEVFKLNISGNITDDVMLKICKLKNLRELHFYKISGIRSLPHEIGQLKLTRLSFTGTSLLEFPEEMKNLPLKKISFEYVETGQLPAFVEQLSRLEILSIRNSPLTSVPDGIEKLTTLKELEITGANFTELNPVVGNLKSLEKLTVSNSLTEFPQIFHCTGLKYLDLSGNKNITSIPPEIGQLKELTALNMGMTGISLIPDEISALKNLKIIQLNDNMLTEIPASLYECVALEKIDVSKNRISIAEPGIDLLINLNEFTAYSNNLEQLPIGLSKCPKLKKVWVHSNQIKANDAEGKVLQKKLGNKYCYKK